MLMHAVILSIVGGRPDLGGRGGTAIAMTIAPASATRAGFLELVVVGIHGRLLGKQCLAVGDRDLIIVRMDFAERQKAMAIAAIVDKGRL